MRGMSRVTLYQFGGAFGLVSLSPFCTKLEAYLRLAGIDYESKPGDPRRAPKGKLPYVRLDNDRIGDSSLIVERLRAAFGDPLDGDLEGPQRALGHLAQRTAEEHLYWGLLHVRWDDDRSWQGGFRDAIGAFLPPLMRGVVPALLRRGVRRSLRAQGLGRHAPDEIAAACAKDLDAFASLLAGRDFLLGDAPTSYDCAVYAMLEHLRVTPSDHPLCRALVERPSLVAYCERMNARIAWPAS